MYEEIEINENEESTELAAYEEPVEEKSGVGLKGVLVGAALIGGTIWGVKKIRKKFCNKDERKAKKIKEAEELLRDAGYKVVNTVEIVPVEDDEFEEVED